MKRLTFALAGLLLLGATTGAQAQSAPRIGYINSQQIIDQAPGAQQAQQEWQQEMATIRSEIQEMGQELEQMMAQYQQQELTLSPEAKANRQAEIRQRQTEYQQRVQELQTQAEQRQQELLQPFMERINAVIEEIRAEGNYAFIFDAATGAIISADPSLDLTEEVLRRLRAQAGQEGQEPQ